MQTESLLTEEDRPRIASWLVRDGHGPTLPRVARELARLEQENQRLGDCIRAIDDERNDANERCATTRAALAAARAEVQRLREDIKAVEEGNSIMGLVADASQKEIGKLKDDNRKWKAESQRLSEELEKAKPVANPDSDLRHRFATLEGRLQGVIETAKLELAHLRNRVEVLEARVR